MSLTFFGTFGEDCESIQTKYGRSIKETQEMFDYLKDYKAKKVTDGYDTIKGTSNAVFNFARIEQYEGDKPELEGHEFVKYELEICEGQDNAGRRLWKSVDLSDEAKVKKLIDMIWTLIAYDFDFSTPEVAKESIQKALEILVTKTVSVKYWGFMNDETKAKVASGEITKENAELIQVHQIKSLAKYEGVKKLSEAPF
jgi:hypothetical protein